MREFTAVLVGAGLTMIGPFPLLGALLMVVAALSWAIRWEAAGDANAPALVKLPRDTDGPGSPASG